MAPDTEPADPIAHAFVWAVMAKLKVTTARDLARKLGVAKTDAEKTVGRWVNGTNAPNFHGTMELLELSGWLKPAALEAWGRAGRQAATPAEAEAALRRAATGGSRPAERVGRRRG